MARLDPATGATIQTLVMGNLAPGTHRQDGFMCVSRGEDKATVIATVRRPRQLFYAPFLTDLLAFRPPRTRRVMRSASGP